jgi:hypothetical protein
MDGPSVRRLVADHPIAAFLVIGNGVITGGFWPVQ